MKIREFDSKDQKEVIELWIKCGLVVPWNNPEKDIARKLQVDPDLFLVGVADGKIVSTVMGGYEGHRGWVNYLAVAPKHQRKGLAKQIMKVVEQKIQEKGCPKINLQVRSTNSEAIGFYQALGYLDDKVIGLGKRLVDDE